MLPSKGWPSQLDENVPRMSVPSLQVCPLVECLQVVVWNGPIAVTTSFHHLVEIIASFLHKEGGKVLMVYNRCGGVFKAWTLFKGILLQHLHTIARQTYVLVYQMPVFMSHL